VIDSAAHSPAADSRPGGAQDTGVRPAPGLRTARGPGAQRIGAEWMGLTKLFRHQILLADIEASRRIAALMAPLQKRLRRHPKLRDEQISGALRQWYALPSFTHLGRVGGRTKDGFSIIETRVVSSKFQYLKWVNPDWEPGISVVRWEFVAEGGLRLIPQPIAHISFHALARRIERGRDRTHPAILADLAALALAPHDAGVVPCASGLWRAESGDAADEAGRELGRILSVRTYVSSDSLP
jgi:hypothetical protein